MTGIVRIALILALAGGEIYAQVIPGGALEAPPLGPAPVNFVLDGAIGEWQGLPPFSIDSPPPKKRSLTH